MEGWVVFGRTKFGCGVEMHREEFGWRDWWVNELMYFIIQPSSFLSFSRTLESSGVAGDG